MNAVKVRLVASQHKLRQLRVSPYLLYNQMMGLLCSILLLLTTDLCQMMGRPDINRMYGSHRVVNSKA